MERLPSITRITVVLLFCLLPFVGPAQIHILHVNGTLAYKTGQSENQTQPAPVTSVFDEGFMIIALDYERLLATISKMDGAPKEYTITTITRQPEGLDCAFMDESSGVVYSLKVVYLQIMEGKPILGISWNSGKENEEAYQLWSENVTLY